MQPLVTVLLDTLQAAQLIRRLIEDWPDVWMERDGVDNRAVHDEVQALVSVVLFATQHALTQSTRTVSGIRGWPLRLTHVYRALQRQPATRAELDAVAASCCAVLGELLQASYAERRLRGRWAWMRCSSRRHVRSVYRGDAA